MIKVPFNDDNSRKGVEGWYAVKGDKLIVYISATNSCEDWISNFLAIPWWSRGAECFVHAGLWKYGLWVDNFITHLIHDNRNSVSSVYLFGFSMGGGIAQIVGEYMPWRTRHVYSIDGPRTTSQITSDCTLYYNRGSLVNWIPPWFRRMKNAICLSDKWRPFWKAHADYDIDKIIDSEIGQVKS